MVRKPPLSVGQLKAILEFLDDETMIDISFDKREGYVYHATVEEDFNENLKVELWGTEE
jgi:hypothetical protein